MASELTPEVTEKGLAIECLNHRRKMTFRCFDVAKWRKTKSWKAEK